MEPRGNLVSYDAASESYDIYTPSQGMVMLRKQISTLSGVPEAKLRVHTRDVGGSFGQRSGVYPEHGALMIAAKRLGRPVKWVGSRAEGFMSDAHGRGLGIAGELALDRDGKFLAARYEFLCDMGAYLTPTGSISHLRNPATLMSEGVSCNNLPHPDSCAFPASTTRRSAQTSSTSSARSAPTPACRRARSARP
jgi:carbon-monoxide dehydrogenase large subunit